jgi:hypothetical protein
LATPVENMPITLDYLKGKRRAEKAIGFIMDLGSTLLACESVDRMAQETAGHLIRLNLDLSVISYQSPAGKPVLATVLAPDLASAVPDAIDIAEHCREQGLRLASARTRELDGANASFDAGEGRGVMQQFTFDYPAAGSGFVSAARIRPAAPDFTSTELALLRHVTVHFISCVRCLPG